MIKRSYFFKVESLPLLAEERKLAGMCTRVTGFVECRSFFAPPTHELFKSIIKRVTEQHRSFTEDEIMLTLITRV